MKKIIVIVILLAFILWIQPINLGRVEIKIDQGTNAKKISQQLAMAKVIRNRWEFLLFLKLLGKENSLEAGTYNLRQWANPISLINQLCQGGKGEVVVVIPEGFNLKEIAARLEEQGLGSRDEFLNLCCDAEFIKSLGIEIPSGHNSSLEGYLFPDTYCFNSDAPAREIIKRFVNNLFTHLEDLGAGTASVHEDLTLASLVEKEAKVNVERRVIASVFQNRLRHNLPLESCATVQYASGQNRVSLSEEDVRIDSPYNTYLHHGLPPYPICSPGKASIEAVLNPARSEYLYFIATGDGTHYFSKTYKEHLIMKKMLTSTVRIPGRSQQ